MKKCWYNQWLEPTPVTVQHFLPHRGGTAQPGCYAQALAKQ